MADFCVGETGSTTEANKLKAGGRSSRFFPTVSAADVGLVGGCSAGGGDGAGVLFGGLLLSSSDFISSFFSSFVSIGLTFKLSTAVTFSVSFSFSSSASSDNCPSTATRGDAKDAVVNFSGSGTAIVGFTESRRILTVLGSGEGTDGVSSVFFLVFVGSDGGGGGELLLLLLQWRW